MARGDVRIAVTLACEVCKRRNYMTNKSQAQQPGSHHPAQVLQVVQAAHESPGDPVTAPPHRISWLETASARKSASNVQARSRSGLPTTRGRARSSRRRAGLRRPTSAASTRSTSTTMTTTTPSRRVHEGRRRPGSAATPEPRTRGGFRVVGFLKACWAELQRVQWPDRRQVGQATAVVLGFVVIAGAFLGLADVVAQRIVNFIL